MINISWIFPDYHIHTTCSRVWSVGFHQIQVSGCDTISWKIWPMGCQISCDVTAIWHSIGQIFQDMTSYPRTWIWWNPTQVLPMQVTWATGRAHLGLAWTMLTGVSAFLDWVYAFLAVLLKVETGLLKVDAVFDFYNNGSKNRINAYNLPHWTLSTTDIPTDITA